MNLNKAALFLIIGLCYTVFYKLILGLFPSVTNFTFISLFFIMLWIVGAFTIIIFAIYFIKEFPPVNKRIKISLIFVILFTSILIIIKLPIEFFPIYSISKRLTFELAHLLNGFSQFLFIIFFYKSISKDIYLLKLPLKVAAWGYGLGFVLGVIEIWFYVNFLTSGIETSTPNYFKLFSLVVTIVSYFAVIIFLSRLRRIKIYSQIIEVERKA